MEVEQRHRMKADLDRAVRQYNEYRSPMATVDVVDRSTRGFRARFEGPFCTTCCRDDYFEDLLYELDRLGYDPESARVTEVERIGPETFEVEFEFDLDAS